MHFQKSQMKECRWVFSLVNLIKKKKKKINSTDVYWTNGPNMFGPFSDVHRGDNEGNCFTFLHFPFYLYIFFMYFFCIFPQKIYLFQNLILLLFSGSSLRYYLFLF
ncbi:hypothetical protein AAZV13_06G096650 [Glycine max]